jgi:hypothetical protein
MCSHIKFPQWILINNTSLKIKRLKIDLRPPKTLAKPYKYPFIDQEKGLKKKGKKKEKDKKR